LSADLNPTRKTRTPRRWRMAVLGTPPANNSGARRQGASGVLLILAGGAFQTVFRLGIAAITARLVSPDETGAFQLAFSIVTLLMAVADPGLSEAMVRKRTQSRAGASTFFWVNLGIGAVLCALVALASGPLTVGLGIPRAQSLV